MSRNYDAIGEMSNDTQFGFLRVLGGWGNVSGPGLFMFRCLVTGTTSAALWGLGMSLLGGMVWGTAALPFMVGSTVGYGVGVYQWYRITSMEALRDLDAYPELLRFHILQNYPWKMGLRERELNWYHSRNFRSNWVRMSMLNSSWMSAKTALDDIEAKREQRIVELYNEEAMKETKEEMV